MSKIFVQPKPLETAVLFLVFNRVDTTKQVFDAIRAAKPPRLYIAGDGPRRGRQDDVKKIDEVRAIVKSVDWPCEVKTLFRDENLGCKYAPSSAITWFFENESQGIILEDDCLPSQSFFWFCEELLERYKNDEHIYLISGDARGSEAVNIQEDYGFCKYPMIWGWASWARVWKEYDLNIKLWPEIKEDLIPTISDNKGTQRLWRYVFDKVYTKSLDTAWDYQLSFLLLKNKARCIIPKRNLIKNIGFGHDATHTVNVNSSSANRKIYEIDFPLNHYTSSKSEVEINDYFDRGEFYAHNLFFRVINKFSRMLFKKNIIK